MKPSAYARAGVDIHLGNRLKAELPRWLDLARRPEVLGKVGGFGGLFAFPSHRYRQPVLVSSIDGVGTKLKLAFAMDRHDTVGQDLVNHCVNDIAVLGAEPLFFLDYIGTGRLEPRVFEALIRGLATACAANRCALIGGETAQMPGFYAPGEYDLCGAIVGVVEKAAVLDGPRAVRVGDVLLGIASNGLHTNGYSLARHVLFDQLKLKPESHMDELGTTVGEELLKIHISYGPLIQKLLRKFQPLPKGSAGRRYRKGPIRAFAHITGGGFLDNIPRVLPAHCDAIIRKGTWEIPPIFRILADCGRIPESEMFHVFNMGVGMVAIVDAQVADAVLRFTLQHGHSAWLIGEVVRGQGQTRIT
ncbi:MAG: phosphoribosylformylglycinamidine cyclo-ligase [Verrucomicrobiota bacterium]|nr:phosphoribosylformylglycinamidine cyclo-ligase [Limisphaera sp.]MDW8380533.1 phosphoribosylformylglycinamidine cyclo-ligase [Verrucomicrobiota bacterium]